MKISKDEQELRILQKLEKSPLFWIIGLSILAVVFILRILFGRSNNYGLIALYNDFGINSVIIFLLSFIVIFLIIWIARKKMKPVSPKRL